MAIIYDDYIWRLETAAPPDGIPIDVTKDYIGKNLKFGVLLNKM